MFSNHLMVLSRKYSLMLNRRPAPATSQHQVDNEDSGN